MLEFYKDRIKKQSVKNFMLHNSRGQFIMQFGRSKEDNVFALDFTGPFSPLAAFGVALVRARFLRPKLIHTDHEATPHLDVSSFTLKARRAARATNAASRLQLCCLLIVSSCVRPALTPPPSLHASRHRCLSYCYCRLQSGCDSSV